jgi:tRNA dimethylallyltransferase
MIIALVGPTASGKTEIAIEAARRFGAEIVGADSRQVYRGLDIGSAKPTAAERAAVPHHLLDVVAPDEAFDCARYRELARAAIDDIEARGRRALVVGGTGLYLKVLRYGLFAGPRRDPGLRARLTAAETAEPGCLHRRLAEVDAAAAARLHARDLARVVRALEVFELTGRPLSRWQEEHAFRRAEVDMRVIGLAVERPALYRRIDERCRAMIDLGLVDEVRRLYGEGFDPNLPALRSPGYAESGDHVRGLVSLGEALDHMSRATRHLAKRQTTWFRRHAPDVWLPPAAAAVIRACEAAWNSDCR